MSVWAIKIRLVSWEFPIWKNFESICNLHATNWAFARFAHRFRLLCLSFSFFLLFWLVSVHTVIVSLHNVYIVRLDCPKKYYVLFHCVEFFFLVVSSSLTLSQTTQNHKSFSPYFYYYSVLNYRNPRVNYLLWFFFTWPT